MKQYVVFPVFAYSSADPRGRHLESISASYPSSHSHMAIPGFWMLMKQGGSTFKGSLECETRNAESQDLLPSSDLNRAAVTQGMTKLMGLNFASSEENFEPHVMIKQVIDLSK